MRNNGMSEMKRTLLKTTCLAAVLAMAGCMPSDPGLLPYGGGGTAASPYVLPDEAAQGTPYGIEDYLEVPGYWQIPFQTTQGDFGAATASFGTLTYDSSSERWLIDINGAPLTLDKVLFSTDYMSA